MTEQEPSSMSLEQRFLEKQRALILDSLEGNELIASNYILVPTEADFEAYYGEYSGDTAADTTTGEGLSVSGLVGDGSQELPR